MISWLFPGQGIQKKGMGKDLFKEFSNLLAQADAVLGYSVQTLCLENPDGKLNQTLYTQPAVYIVNALSSFQKTAQGATLPDFVAGHSLGEYNALLVAGAFDFATGLKLVQKRAELLSQTSQTIDGAMAAVINLGADELQTILLKNGLDTVDIANFNTPLQTVISGIRTDVIQAMKILETMKTVRCLMLKVSGAFHSRYMYAAQQAFASFIGAMEFNKLKIPVISNVTARPYEQAEIATNLTAQITHQVNWVESVQYLMQQGNMSFEELGSSNVLTKLLPQIKIEVKSTHAREVNHTEDNNEFNQFLTKCPQCERLYKSLSVNDDLLAKSFETVFKMHSKRLGRYAVDLLSFLEQSEYQTDYIERFTRRVKYLNFLQESFDTNPIRDKLYDPSAQVDRGDYNVALLLSIIVSNHRMEIMQSLAEFIAFIKRPQGCIASIGMGTGYELKLIHDTLPGWTIEGYDNDKKAHEDARKLLHYFNVPENNIRFGGLFPDDRPAADATYDAILLCELLEHLEDPSGF